MGAWMKQVGYAAIFFVALCSGPMREGWADETVPSEPPSFLAWIKTGVDYLEPTPELGVFVSFKDLGDGNFSQFEGFAGLSGAIWKFTSHDIELGSWRVGGQFEGDRKFYTTLGINGIGLAKRYLPENIKDTLSPGFMAAVWNGLDKYGSVAVGVGLSQMQDMFASDYTLEENAGLIGTVGVRIPF